MKLTTRLALLFFFLAILPVTAAGYIAYENGREAIEDNLTTHLITTSELKAYQFFQMAGIQ